MAVKSCQTFLALLRRSRLFNDAEWQQAADLASASSSTAADDPQALARGMMRRGLLTSWQAQQLLSGRNSFHLGAYRLVDRLGQGRFGVVFKAVHPDHPDTAFALKVLPAENMANPHVAARFEREVRLASRLKHPHIVNAFEAQEVHGIHFLVMEYMPGRTLRQWIKEFGRLPIDWSCECMRQAALGLDYAASLGIVHRDVKPSNMIVDAVCTDSQPLLKVLDLGVARALGEDGDSPRLTKPGHVVGTVDYIAPEQVQNTQDVDARADIYSLGCTLFHALTGQTPFPGENWAERMMARLKMPAPGVRTLRQDVPLDLEDLVARMLERDPEDRIQSCEEVALALEPFCRGADPLRFAAIRIDGPHPIAAMEPKIIDERVGDLEKEVSELRRRLCVLERLIEGSLDSQVAISARTP